MFSEKEGQSLCKVYHKTEALVSQDDQLGLPQLQQDIQISGQQFSFEVDTGAGNNFCSIEVWSKLGKPSLTPTTSRYEVANGQPLPTLGTLITVSLLEKGTATRTENITFTVSKVSRLHLLGHDAIVQLCINLPALLGISSVLPSTEGSNGDKAVLPILKDLKPDGALQEAFKRMCQDFPDLFKQELI